MNESGRVRTAAVLDREFYRKKLIKAQIDYAVVIDADFDSAPASVLARRHKTHDKRIDQLRYAMAIKVRAITETQPDRLVRLHNAGEIDLEDTASVIFEQTGSCPSSVSSARKLVGMTKTIKPIPINEINEAFKTAGWL